MFKIRRALVSVSDKSDLIPFVKGLAELGAEILSTGGTAKQLREAKRNGVALAPTLGAAFWLAGGYQLMLGIGFIFAFVGGLLLWLVSKQTIQTDA